MNCEGARGRLLVPQLLCGDRHHWFVFVLSPEEFYSQQVAPYLDSSGDFSLRLVIHLLFTSQIRPYQHSAISISQILTTSDGAEAVDGRLPLLRGLHLPSHQRPRRPGEVEHWTISKSDEQQSQTARHLGLCYITALLTTGLAQQRYAFMNMSIIRWRTSCAPSP